MNSNLAMDRGHKMCGHQMSNEKQQTTLCRFSGWQMAMMWEMLGWGHRWFIADKVHIDCLCRARDSELVMGWPGSKQSTTNSSFINTNRVVRYSIGIWREHKVCVMYRFCLNGFVSLYLHAKLCFRWVLKVASHQHDTFHPPERLLKVGRRLWISIFNFV